jgi:3D (Asp-Asp-Asp) domain-containing protein
LPTWQMFMKVLAMVATAVLFCTTALSFGKPAIAKGNQIPKEKPAITKTVRIPIIRRAWSRIAVRATAYVVNARARGCSLNIARTASGTVAGPGTIAVDTRMFPFGTRFYIPGYGYGRATDTGGYIRGQHIDLAMRSCSRALAWGSRTVMVSYTLPNRTASLTPSANGPIKW